MRLKILLGIFCIIFLCTGVVSALSNSGGGSWNYFRAVTLTETSGSTLNDYEILVSLNSGNFDFAKSKSDGSDIRFTDYGGNEISYWIEEWNSGAKTARVWVKVPVIQASGPTNLKIWYGNPLATSSSNGDATFEFFDDFQTGGLDPNKWNVFSQGSNARVEVSNGICKIISPSSRSSAGISSKAFFNINSIFVVKRAKFTTGPDSRGPMQRQGFLDATIGGSNQNEIDHGTEFGSESWVRWVTMNSGTLYSPYRDWADVGISEGTYYISGIGWHSVGGTRSVSWYKNNQRISSMDYSSNTYVPSSPMHVWLYSAPYSGGDSNYGYMAVDYAFVRNYAASEPIISVFQENAIYPVLVLHFDEGSGTVAHDLSGNGKDGTIYGATWVDGISGKALDFNGNSYVDLGNLGLSSSTGTIEAWIKPRDVSCCEQIFSGRDASLNNNIQFYLTTSSNAGFYTHHGTQTFQLLTPVQSNTWSHVVVTHDGSTTKLYMNGELKQEASNTDWFDDLSASGVNQYTVGYLAGYLNNYHFNGIIDEVRIYQRTLSTDEILAHYNALAPDLKKPDLTLEDLAISSTNPKVGEPVKISVFVKNALGAGSFTDDFYVNFYLGDPDKNIDGIIDSDANVLGSKLIQGGLPSGISRSIWTDWTPQSPGATDIFVVADPKLATGDQIDESDETNNEASIQIFPTFPGKILPVPHLYQGQNNWCWANCIAMILQYYGKLEDGHQIHGWDVGKAYNKGPDEVASFGNFYPADISGLKKYFSSYGLEAESEMVVADYWEDFCEKIKDKIDKYSTPVALGFIRKDFSGHMILVRGYSVEPTGKYFYINDPGEVEEDQNIKIPFNEFFSRYHNPTNVIFFINKEYPANPHQATMCVIDKYTGSSEGIYHKISFPEIESSTHFSSKGLTWSAVKLPFVEDPPLENNWLRVFGDSNLDPQKLLIGNIYLSNSGSIPFDGKVIIKLSQNEAEIDRVEIPDIIIPPKKAITSVTSKYLNLKNMKKGNGRLEYYLMDNYGTIVDYIGPIDFRLFPPVQLIKELKIISKCPVDISITDPDGLLINKTNNEILDGATYTELGIGSDGTPDSQIFIPNKKTGIYSITVTPKQSALLTDIYTLEISSGTETETIADKIPIKNIPSKPYFIKVTQDGSILILNNETPIAEFPSVFLPATMIIGILGTVLYIQRTREN